MSGVPREKNETNKFIRFNNNLTIQLLFKKITADNCP